MAGGPPLPTVTGARPSLTVIQGGKRLTPDSPVVEVSGIGPKNAVLLQKVGIETVRDLLLNLPYDWAPFESVEVAGLTPGTAVTLVGTVRTISARSTPRRGIKLAEATVEADGGGRIKVAWFNQPKLAYRYRPGDRIALAGTVTGGRYGLQMSNPHHEKVVGRAAEPRHIGERMPKYHETKGLSSRRIAEWVREGIPVADQLEDVLPEEVRRRHALPGIAQTVRDGHQQESEQLWKAARDRMAFAELFVFQAAFAALRRQLDEETAVPIPYRQEVIDTFKAGVGFELTNAQRKAIWDVFRDVAREHPMNRLLNGDVGSGKTAVAAAAVAMTHAAGLQSVVMAPTEILARQHLVKFREYLEGSFPGLTVELLVSGLPAAERRRVRTSAASGHCALVVGTHALIEEDVEIADLGLAVVDEQHRFGTAQRELLRAKGRGRPHFLAMTATPIPRTLALAVFGEMSVSVLDELPPGRTPIRTEVLAGSQREAAYRLVREEVAKGRQAFVICPLVEESEKLAARAAVVEFERLQREVFPDLRLALVHGKLRQKDEVMRAFAARESDVLVATSVVEVGVDVPNASVMLIEGAERFGLAQLHQFRGRVGRGAAQSHCVLLTDLEGPVPRRLQLVAGTQDGFSLAEADLELRGMGELMGQRQHGDLGDLGMRALQNPELLSEAREEAEAVLAADPGLERNPALRAAVLKRLEQTVIS